MPFTRPNKEEIQQVQDIQLSDDNSYFRIETPRLIIEPVTRNDADAYCKIFCDEENMRMYQNGEAKAREWVEKRLDGWASKWEKGYPYAGMKVQLKKPDGKAGETIGHIVSGDAEEVGVSEMAFAFKRYADNGDEVWNHRFGTEAVNAMVNHAIPLLKNKGIQLMVCPAEEAEKLANLSRVVATSRPDNTASGKLLEQFFDGKKIHARSGTAAHKYKDARDIYSHHVPYRTAVEKLEVERGDGDQLHLGGKRSEPQPRKGGWADNN